jgi:PAS domain S-box-containing protein
MIGKNAQYEIKEKLYDSESTIVYRGYDNQNRTPVVLKVMKPDSTTKQTTVSFKHEFGIVSKLNLPGIVKALAMEDYDTGSLMIVLEDIGGDSLDHLLKRIRLSPIDSLELMIAITNAVGLVHRQRVIHKDINPSNIIYNPETKEVNLIDFDLADETPERSIAPQAPSALEGTLEYISPEQTGRMNRPVDYRTDFYSLGVTFYRMLTGRLPFEAKDDLGMVYNHIAELPIPPHRLDNNIPEMISRIVMKLLSKMADDRYQSAWGLKADLEKCLTLLKTEGEVRLFELGIEDYSDQLHIPQRLYGRQKEIEHLTRAFDRASDGERALLLVAGYSGVGKTALVHEIYRPVVEKRGYFVEGKFDQLQRNVPYTAWVQALTGFVDFILMESEDRLAHWSRGIQSAVGSIGKVLTDVIPNLELVIGVQPNVTPLDSLEAQNRFSYVFLEFIKAIATAEHPLVIFLDDLQWIDDASLGLLETLTTSNEVTNMLVVGAYRDNEVDNYHPLMKTVKALRDEKANIDLLKLNDLTKKTVNELISDTVYRSFSDSKELTRLVYSKTCGNPFFLRQTLKALVEKQAIFFDIKSRQWKWDISILNGMNITDNVVDLMLAKIRLLDPAAQRILPLAACMGFKFNPSNLGIIAERSEDAVTEGLRPALREGLVVPVGDEFKFVHDRVQQAAYTLIPDKEKKKLHLKIGKLLLKHSHEREDQEEQLFTIVDHLNIGAELLSDRNDKLELACLNLSAGLKAKDSAAFSAAAKYFESGIDMLDDESWSTDYDLTLKLHSQAADVDSLIGEFERTDLLFAVVTGHAGTAEDMVGVYESQMHSYLSQGKLKEAVDISLECFERLGLHLPGYPTDEDIARAIAETKSLYSDRPIEDLINLPRMTDPNKLAILRIHKKSGPAAYISRPTYVLLQMLSQVSVNIQYGNADESPNAYATYAFFLSGVQREYDEGYRFAKLALDLLDVVDSSKIIAKTMCMIGGHVWHFRHHLRETLPYLEKGYEFGLKTGDFENASYDAEFCCINSYFAGAELQQLEQLFEFYGESMRRIRAEAAANIIAPYWQAVKNLLSASGDPCILTGERFNQATRLPIYEQEHNHVALAAFYVNQLLLCYLFENYEQALESSESAEYHTGGMLGMFTHSVAIFYDSLTRIQVYPHRTPAEQAKLLEKISANQQIMKGLADSAPMNFLHKFYLVEAERMRLDGEGMATLDYYDKAVSLARENGFTQEEALANELAAKFCSEKGKEEFAKAYMKEAYRCYESWGAVRKVKDLEARYSHLLETRFQNNRSGSKAGNILELLDLTTLMKTTRAISGEIKMDRLLNEVMHIIMENAGAQSGYILQEQAGVWQIMAKSGAGVEEGEMHVSVGIDKHDTVSSSIVRYVARTKESVVLDDAASKGNFTNDPHIMQEKTKSLLCAPLLSRGRLVGILYLENNLTTGVFTSARVQLLEILLSQAATSLENALTYESLCKSEAEYRRIVDTANEGIWAVDPDSITTFVNARMADMLGYTPKEMLGHQLTDFLFEADFPDQSERTHNRHKGVFENFERRLRRKDGTAIWTLISATPIFDSEHRFQGSFAMLTDITEHKQYEDRQREFYRRTILAATDGKLQLTEKKEIEKIAGSPAVVFRVEDAEDFRHIRTEVTDIARSLGMDETRVGDYVVSVGEAVTNAIKHAGGAEVSIHTEREAILSVISDNGPGIEAMSIPEVALKKGYTTTGTLGMGYKVMTSISDKVYLATGSWGTTVGIEMSIKPTETIPDIEAMYHAL